MSDSETNKKKEGEVKTLLSTAPLARLTGSGSGEFHVVERVVREELGTSMMLTRTNYMEWALFMQARLQAGGLWAAVNTAPTTSAMIGAHCLSSSPTFSRR